MDTDTRRAVTVQLINDEPEEDIKVRAAVARAAFMESFANTGGRSPNDQRVLLLLAGLADTTTGMVMRSTLTAAPHCWEVANVKMLFSHCGEADAAPARKLAEGQWAKWLTLVMPEPATLLHSLEEKLKAVQAREAEAAAMERAGTKVVKKELEGELKDATEGKSEGRGRGRAEGGCNGDTPGTLIVPAAMVRGYLPMLACITALETGLVALETGSASMPLRFGYELPQDEFSILASMPSFYKPEIGGGGAGCTGGDVAAVAHTQAVQALTESVGAAKNAYRAAEDEDAGNVCELRGAWQALKAELKGKMEWGLPGVRRGGAGGVQGGKRKRYCCNKCITVFPGNRARGKHSHQGAIMLFEAESGALEAIVDATEVTAVRTAAASAVATRVLASPLTPHLALLGCGAQAMVHLEAMLAVRGSSIEKVTVWSRTESRVRAFVAAARNAFPGGPEVVASASAQEAVDGGDIICTLTAARGPVLRSEWVKDGCHVNAVGACTPTHRELDTALVSRARLFADSRISCIKESGDIVVPLQEGAITEEHVLATLGELLIAEKVAEKAGAQQGRQGAGDVTLFESLGLAIHDLVAALEVVERANVAGEEGCTRVQLN